MKSKIDKLSVLNFSIIILAVVFAINLCSTIYVFVKGEAYYTYEETSLLYFVKEGDYSNLIEGVHERKYINPSDSQTYKEISAVVEYFEAASLYHAYQKMGDTTEEKKFQQKMVESSSLLGELSFVEEDINKKLGME